MSSSTFKLRFRLIFTRPQHALAGDVLVLFIKPLSYPSSSCSLDVAHLEITEHLKSSLLSLHSRWIQNKLVGYSTSICKRLSGVFYVELLSNLIRFVKDKEFSFLYWTWVTVHFCVHYWFAKGSWYRHMPRLLVMHDIFVIGTCFPLCLPWNSVWHPHLQNSTRSTKLPSICLPSLNLIRVLSHDSYRFASASSSLLIGSFSDSSLLRSSSSKI
jgi:hypothetical protein